MPEFRRRLHGSLGVVPAAALTALAIMACGSTGSGPAPGQAKGPDFGAFYEAAEKGDLAAALAALPPALRDASPYTSSTAGLPPSRRDEPIYFKLAADLDATAPVSQAAGAEAAVHYSLGVLAYRQADWETARRRFLLALQRDARLRMAHVYLGRTYAELEEAALKEAKEGEDPGAVLIAKVGIGSSDQHIEMAQQILDEDVRADLPALLVSFRYDKGAVKDFKAEWTTASGNARIQRPAASRPSGACRVELSGRSRVVLDEKAFPAVQIVYWDGQDAAGHAIGGRDELTAFSVSLELLSLSPGERVTVFDDAGRMIFSAPVPASAPAEQQAGP